MIVVSDASPLTALAAVGRLGLLADLYARVVVPERVYPEITRVPGRSGADALQATTWLEVQRCPPSAQRDVLRDVVDDEALALAVALQADLILMDERKGRREAARLGLTPLGVVGVLVEAKALGHLAAVRPVLDARASGSTVDSSPACSSRLGSGPAERYASGSKRARWNGPGGATSKRTAGPRTSAYRA